MRDVTSTFNIFKHGRTNHNNRAYVLKAMQNLINSPETQESIKLGEAYGYYGHGKRAKSKKLMPDEFEVVMINGKPVALDQVPSNITTSLEIDDEGNVTHTQRISDTLSGKSIDAMEKTGMGGWSIALEGSPQNPRKFGGFDYVKQPSYISSEKQKLMLESVEDEEIKSIDDLVIHNLKEVGFGDDSQLILESWNGLAETSDFEQSLELENLMLESLLASEKTLVDELRETASADKAAFENQIKTMQINFDEQLEKRQQLMFESLEKMPVIATQEQQNAFVNPQSDDDIKTVGLMFESLQNNLKILPSNMHQKTHINKSPSHSSSVEFEGAIDLSGKQDNPFIRNI